MGPRNRAVVQPLAPDSPMDAFGAGWWEGSLGTRGGGGGGGLLHCLGSQERNAGFPRRAVTMSESSLYSRGSSLGH